MRRTSHDGRRTIPDNQQVPEVTEAVKLEVVISETHIKQIHTCSTLLASGIITAVRDDGSVIVCNQIASKAEILFTDIYSFA
jgi:hypothetical protein